MTDPHRPLRVLIADDTVTIRLLLRHALEASRRFEVVDEAGDGARAVELATALEPDIVLLDLSMPVLGGMEAIPLIRQGAPESMIVVLSGFDAHGAGARALEAGASAFLAKNQRPGDLVAGLLQAWERRRGGGPADDVPADGFRAAFDGAPVAMALLGPDGRVLYPNRAWCRLTGRTAVELRGLTVAELTAPEDREAGGGARRGRAASPTATREVRLARPDGRTVWASVGLADTAGTVVATMADVTEHKRAERELARSNAELSSFAYLAAHELKAPLQALSGFAALLDRVHGAQLDHRGREFVGWILDGASRMNALVEDLLAYCSMDRSEPVMGPVSLDQVLVDARHQLKAEVTAREARIEAGPLPVVTGDPAQLGQLLQNLLANALKFVPDGRRPDVRVSAERSADGWTVTVADNGIGVDEAARERIFGMFVRLHPRERFPGTGIGLSICKRIVERRGGALWVEPGDGRGSRFRFTLPDVLALPGEAPAA